jgi:twitching motility two-component system response regulator PilH
MKKILVVDDSLTARQMIKEMLSSNEHVQLFFAVTGEEGIKKAEEITPDLIIMDVVMPGLNGFQATKQIKSKMSSFIIICASKGEDDDKSWGLRQGADDYLVKPFKKDDLISSINKFINIG